MDSDGNVNIFGFTGDPNILIHSVIQMDSYQIAKENIRKFQIIILSLQRIDKFLIQCKIELKN
jgi:hypothetical protein